MRHPPMSLRGRSILIVESGAAQFIVELQEAIERAGAESLVAVDVAAALERCEQFSFDAALINIEHRAAGDRLGLPLLLYAAGPSDVDEIVARLERLLRGL